jgi:hypothetical protein
VAGKIPRVHGLKKISIRIETMFKKTSKIRDSSACVELEVSSPTMDRLASCRIGKGRKYLLGQWRCNGVDLWTLETQK